MTTTKTIWTAADCWPDFTSAMDALGVTAESTDADIEAVAMREAPKAAKALGCETSVQEFAEAMRAWRDEA